MNKKLVLLIGCPGSGKSSFVNSYLQDYVYISQDTQGKVEHFTKFTEAITNSVVRIVIDRMNHTISQRLKYVSVALENGYYIEYKIFSAPYKTCLERVINRVGHPTLKQNDVKSARNALDTFHSQFEYPSKGIEKYDSLNRDGKIYGQQMSLLHFGRKTIIVGDLHGCYDELMLLLAKAKYNPETDLLISCGDLNDRGPYSDKVIEFFLSHPNRYVIRGNHDSKLIRYLKGNKVNLESIQTTIDQFGDRLNDQNFKDELYYKMMDFPYIICANFKNYITHAGFHPDRHPSNNSQEFCMYARYYDPQIKTFSQDSSLKYWFEHERKYNQYQLFYGHIIFDQYRNDNGIHTLDGGCYNGGKLRAAVLSNLNDLPEIVEVDSLQPKTKEEKEWDHQNKFEIYDKFVEMGYLNKKEKGELVLFNYTDHCQYDNFWNKYTMECRGLILNKETGDTVARPLPKFFNLSQLENSNLGEIPKNEAYEVYEKLDGSLGILFQDPEDNQYKFATRGSFDSEQAKKATEIWNNILIEGPGGRDEHMSSNGLYYYLLQVKPELQDYTLLFEVIYPENRLNDGARLVCDYGTNETLILLAGINKFNKNELDRATLEYIADYIALPICKKYDYTIEDLVKMKETLPVTEEGWVVKFKPSNFRVKIKGDEYCKLQKILNSISPLSIYEKMMDSQDFRLTKEYLTLIPEEIRPEVIELEEKLFANYLKYLQQAYLEMRQFECNVDLDGSIKSLALDIKNTNNYMLPSGIYFAIFNKDDKKTKNIIKKYIRPTSNKL